VPELFTLDDRQYAAVFGTTILARLAVLSLMQVLCIMF